MNTNVEKMIVENFITPILHSTITVRNLTKDNFPQAHYIMEKYLKDHQKTEEGLGLKKLM